MHLEVESNGTVSQWHLDACPGAHPQDWSRCGADVLACRRGPAHEMPEFAAGSNRVLTALPFLTGTEVIRHVDLADVDETYGRGARVVTLLSNTGVFHDHAGRRPVWAVQAFDLSDACLYAALFDSLEAAQAEFEARIEP